MGNAAAAKKGNEQESGEHLETIQCRLTSLFHDVSLHVTMEEHPLAADPAQENHGWEREQFYNLLLTTSVC